MSSCLCKNSEGAVSPFQIESAERSNKMMRSTLATLTKQTMGRVRRLHFHKHALDHIGRSQLSPQMLGKAEERPAVPAGLVPADEPSPGTASANAQQIGERPASRRLAIALRCRSPALPASPSRSRACAPSPGCSASCAPSSAGEPHADKPPAMAAAKPGTAIGDDQLSAARPFSPRWCRSRSSPSQACWLSPELRMNASRCRVPSSFTP